jgi:dihydropyrimidinase
VKGWPLTVISRGKVIVSDGELLANEGQGEFLKCNLPEYSILR